MKSKTKRVMVVGFDGADPRFVDTLIKQGKMPNFKKLQDQGTTTQNIGMIGALPTITPPCWATLATGAWPGTHGITCFWNHTSGRDLDDLDLGWNSKQCNAEFIWDSYAKAGKKSIVFNYPTAFPPTSTENVIYIDGTNAECLSSARVDMDKLYFAKKGDFELETSFAGKNDTGAGCVMTEEVESKKFDVTETQEAESGEDHFSGLFEVGHVNEGIAVGNEAEWMSIVDKFETPIKAAHGWEFDIGENALEVVLPMNTGRLRRMGLLIPDQEGKYNSLKLYGKKKEEGYLGEVTLGEWSDWIYDAMLDKDGDRKEVVYKIRLYKLADDASEMELYASAAMQKELGEDHVYPQGLAKELMDNVGPFVLPSNAGRPYPYIGQETWALNNIWCADAINYLLDNKEWDLFYCHLHSIDCANHNMISDICPESPRYEGFHDLLVKYYENIDETLGKMLYHLDDGETAIFVVSDHAGLPRKYGYPKPLIADSWGIVIDIMRDLGYVKTKKDENGKTQIDWEHTTAVSQRSGYIYVNLKGREPHGCVDPKDYDALLDKLIDDLYAYRDPKTNERIVDCIVKRDGMEALGLYGEHVGDLYFILHPHCTQDHASSFSSTESYEFSMKCLFFAAGAGIKENNVMERRVHQVDLVPTICELQEAPVPDKCEGGIIYQLLDK